MTPWDPSASVPQDPLAGGEGVGADGSEGADEGAKGGTGPLPPIADAALGTPERRAPCAPSTRESTWAAVWDPSARPPQDPLAGSEGAGGKGGEGADEAARAGAVASPPIADAAQGASGHGDSHDALTSERAWAAWDAVRVSGSMKREPDGWTPKRSPLMRVMTSAAGSACASADGG